VAAGTTAAAMYFDAKTGIGADITALRGFKKGGKIWEEAGIYIYIWPSEYSHLTICSEAKENQSLLPL